MNLMNIVLDQPQQHAIETIGGLMQNLNHKNKLDCLEMIMTLDAEIRYLFLNPFVKAVDRLH